MSAFSPGVSSLPSLSGISDETFAGRGIPWLEWSAINEPKRIVTVPAAVSKTRKPRSVEGLPPTPCTWLAKIPASERGDTVSHARSWQIGEFGSRTLGLERWPVDVLRWHSFASYHMALHKNPPLTAYLMQHVHTSPTELYEGVAREADTKRYFMILP